MIIKHRNRQRTIILIYMQINWFILMPLKKKTKLKKQWLYGSIEDTDQSARKDNSETGPGLGRNFRTANKSIMFEAVKHL